MEGTREGSLEKRKLEELVKVVEATLRSALQPCRLSRCTESLVGKLERGDDEKKLDLLGDERTRGI